MLLLLKHNAKATVKNVDGVEPTHNAALTGVPHLKTLFAVGSSLEAEDYGGGRPLNWTAVTVHVEIGQFLISEGADKDHACRKFGNSALFSAISSLQCEFIDMLLDHRGGRSACQSQR